MAFDKAAFRSFVKEQYAVAANPTFVPTPDPGIADEGARYVAHAAAQLRALKATAAAVADVAGHAAAMLVSACVPEVMAANAAPVPGSRDTDEIPTLAQQVDAAMTDGSGDRLADAAVLLLVAAFDKLVKE